jgi:hypothetical protein
MGGACSMYGEGEKCIQGFGLNTWGKENTWKIQPSMGGQFCNGPLGSGMVGHELD